MRQVGDLMTQWKKNSITLEVFQTVHDKDDTEWDSLVPNDTVRWPSQYMLYVLDLECEKSRADGKWEQMRVNVSRMLVSAYDNVKLRKEDSKKQ